MVLFEIATFEAFASVLIAARKLGTDPVSLDGAKALADLAGDGKTLAAALRDAGLAPLARDMASAAAQAERITHPGPALEDAKAIFRQVAPEAFADPSIFAAEALDAAAVTEAMVRAIKASEQKKDFEAHPLAERYFREVARLTLGRMLDDADYIASITPALWREALARQGVMLNLLTRIDEATRQTETRIEAVEARYAELTSRLEASGAANAALESGVSREALLRLVRPIAADIDDIPQAMIELTRAVDIAWKVQEEGRHGSNLGDFVDEVLRRSAALSARGRHEAAISELDDALEREEAESMARKLRLLSRSIDEHLLLRDAAGAARQIVRRVTLETPIPRQVFSALRREWEVWYGLGRDKGARLDIEVAAALARACVEHALSPGEQLIALNDLGGTLATLGERESGAVHLEEALGVFRALEAQTKTLPPAEQARTQHNLGIVLALLGTRETSTARLEDALSAFCLALKMISRMRAPREWARTLGTFGNVLRAWGEREVGTQRLKKAVQSHRMALVLRARDRNHMPLDWAMTQNNLGNALASLGKREPGNEHLEKAVLAYRSALEEWTQDSTPHEWALARKNLGSALATIGTREPGTAHLDEAVSAYEDALKVWTWDEAPLHRANALGDQGLAKLKIAERNDDVELAREALFQMQEAARALRAGGHLQWALDIESNVPSPQTIVEGLSRPPA